MLVDTSVLLPFLTGGESAGSRYLERCLREGQPVFLSGFAIQEVLQGARDQREWQRLFRYLAGQPRASLKDPVDSHIAAARIYFDCRRGGLTVCSTEP